MTSSSKLRDVIDGQPENNIHLIDTAGQRDKDDQDEEDSVNWTQRGGRGRGRGGHFRHDEAGGGGGLDSFKLRNSFNSATKTWKQT